MQAKRGESDPAQETENARPNVLKMNTLGERWQDAAEVVGARIELATHGFSVRAETSENQGKTPTSDDLGANVGAVETKISPFSPDLQAIIDTWPALPDAIKAGIVAMVKAAGEP